MPRRRVRTTQKASWDVALLAEAFEAVKNGTKTIRQAAKYYGIPYTTLHDRLKSNNISKVNFGRPTIFTQAQEKEMADHVILLSKLFFGITITELRKMAFSYAEKLKVSHNFCKETNLAGRDWLEGFMRRNPEISLRSPQATSINRITAFNKEEIKIFFDNLEGIMLKFKFTPDKIFNVDETGISTVQKPCRLLAEKGGKRVGTVVSWERGRNVTVVCAMSASGSFIPPMFIYPRQRLSKTMKRDGPAASSYQCSKTGWINEDLFVIWLQHFTKHCRPDPENPVLLVLDNHSSHISLASYEFCRQNGIIMLSLPPHTSHRMQPLDVSFYAPLKKTYNQVCRTWLVNHPHDKITPDDLGGIFNAAYMKVATIEKAVNGFRKTGICPLDPNIFGEEDFLPSNLGEISVVETDLSNEDGPSLSPVARSLNPTEPDLSNEDGPSLSPVARSLNPTEPDLSNEDGPSLSPVARSLNPTEPDLNNDDGPSLSPVARSLITTEPDDHRPSCSFQEIAPLPKKKSGSKINANKRGKMHSEVLTSTPKKAALDEKIKKKMKAQQTKEARERRKPKGAKQDENINTKRKRQRCSTSQKTKKACRKSIFPDSSSEDDVLSVDLCDDDECDDIEPMICETKDICILCGDEGQDNELWFRCTVCSDWAHAACTGHDSATNYICDFCQ